ncbi:hypothetical protein H072_9745 [Dactylellina haptotyla CBS 200.50]|uniref:CBM-cenC domain-containing protein n=1 Tax=Dactylellina haptotyla (strain CBS 200.50) TaxID=1284197 RepID=S8A0Z6_DACHA|nr:hypothetical protein H072_9745 [Dactylellina haptotyla CBS 200.50]
MKPQNLLAFLPLASAAIIARYPPDYCHADNCLRAIRGTESIGRYFCSSTLQLEPVTVTFSSTEIYPTYGLTTVYTGTETETITVVTGTSATTLPPILDRRRDVEAREVNPDDAVVTKKISNILKMCVTNEARIISACSCLLKTGQNVTVTTTEYDFLPTTVPTLSDYEIVTQTVGIEAKVTYLPLIKNSGFDHPVEPLRHWVFPEHWCDPCTHEVVPNDGSSSSPNALKIVYNEGPNAKFYQDVTVEIRKYYKFKFQFKIGSATSKSYPEFYMDYGFSNDLPVMFRGVASNQWQTIEVGPTLMEWRTNVAIEVRMFVPRAAAEPTESFYFDSFEIWEVQVD